MTEPSRPGSAGAGLTLVTTMLLCGAAAFAARAAIDVALSFGLAGMFAGLFLGFALVYTRFKDI